MPAFGGWGDGAVAVAAGATPGMSRMRSYREAVEIDSRRGAAM
jgi:hypothetical protein